MVTILQHIHLSGDHVRIHVYCLSDEGPSQEELDEEDLAAANHWMLPSTDFHGLWDSLVFDSHIKAEVLYKYSSGIEYSRHFHVHDNS